MQPRINTSVKGLSKSATLAINEKVKLLKQLDVPVYSFGLGQSPFPVPSVIVQSLKDHAHQKDYLHVQGLEALRIAVARFHEREDDLICHADNIIIGPGSKELIFIAQLCFDGDLLLPVPSWVSYAPQARILSKPVVQLKTLREDNWQLNPEVLLDYCQTSEDPFKAKLLILNYPSNPCGSTYTPTRLKELAAICKKYNVIVISDEIYAQLNHESEHISLANFYPEGTIVSSGLSKWCGAGGWRLGTFMVPDELEELKNAMIVVASETFTSVSAPIQYAAIEAYKESEELANYLHHSRKILKCLGGWIVDKLSAVNVRVSHPEGAFYIFPDFEAHRKKLEAIGVTTSSELSTALLEKLNVATLPGSDFGMKPGELYVRMSYVDFDGAGALSGSKTTSELDEDFLLMNCPAPLAGIQKITQWLKEL